MILETVLRPKKYLLIGGLIISRAKGMYVMEQRLSSSLGITPEMT
jgi:hypothetical protein